MVTLTIPMIGSLLVRNPLHASLTRNRPVFFLKSCYQNVHYTCKQATSHTCNRLDCYTITLFVVTAGYSMTRAIVTIRCSVIRDTTQLARN